jgi:hypothetical protein
VEAPPFIKNAIGEDEAEMIARLLETIGKIIDETPIERVRRAQLVRTFRAIKESPRMYNLSWGTRRDGVAE